MRRPTSRWAWPIGTGPISRYGSSPSSAGRDVVGVDHRARLAVVGELDGGDEIEPQADEVDEIVAREGLAADVRVDEPQPAEASLGGAQAADVGEIELAGVADDDGVDLAGAVDEDADLAARSRTRPRRATRVSSGVVMSSTGTRRR